MRNASEEELQPFWVALRKREEVAAALNSATADVDAELAKLRTLCAAVPGAKLDAMTGAWLDREDQPLVK